MRADPEQQARFASLREGPYFEQVVTANRAYLMAAVPDVVANERDHWSLSCLPKTGSGRRLSTMNMRRMETLVLFRPDGTDDGDDEISGVVVVRESVLRAEAGQDIEDQHPHLAFDRSRYADAGEDQMRIWGWYEDLLDALAEAPVAAAARDLAESLLSGRTNHAGRHNYQLADHVLGRAASPAPA